MLGLFEILERLLLSSLEETEINGVGFWRCESTEDVVDMIDGLTGEDIMDEDMIVGVEFC